MLEIGLGYGTVAQRLAEAGFDYHGIDIAAGPVEMVRERLRMLGVPDADRRVTRASALVLPHPDNVFGHIVSIGCLHHTGDLPRALAEIHRVLAPGGTAMVMLYNRHSYRQLMARWQALAARLRRREERTEERLRAAYDANTAGEAAPETIYVTARQVRDELFARFADVRVERHNADDVRLISIAGHDRWLRRERALPILAPALGLDLYIHARK
jgi:ubiquinone/menaquinone biosynthesis C-methylase UbiE